MKILLALLICGIIIGALTYIFFPGHVAVTSTNAEIVNATIVEIDWINPANNSGKSQIFWKVDITVENQNRVLTINIDKLDVYLRIDVSKVPRVFTECNPCIKNFQNNYPIILTFIRSASLI